MTKRKITLLRQSPSVWLWSVDEPAVDVDHAGPEGGWIVDVERSAAANLGHGKARSPTSALRDALNHCKLIDAPLESSFKTGGDA